MTRAGRVALVALALAPAGCEDDGDGAEERRVAGGGHVREDRVDPDAVRRVLSVRLTRSVPPTVAAACREASREPALRVPVICPRLVPDVGIVREQDVPNVEIPYPPAHYDLTFNTRVLDPRHWVVGAGGPASVKQSTLSDELHVVKGLPKLLKRLRVGSEPVALYWYQPPGGAVHEGHVIAFVRTRGLALYASIHGRRYRDAAVAMALDMARSVPRP